MKNACNVKEKFINELLEYYTKIFEEEKNIKTTSMKKKCYHVTYANRKIKLIKKILLEEHFLDKILNGLNTNDYPTFSENDIEIIKTRFGMYNNEKSNTLEETAKLFNTTKQNVGRIITKLKKEIAIYIESRIKENSIIRKESDLICTTNLKETLNLPLHISEDIYATDLESFLNLSIFSPDWTNDYYSETTLKLIKESIKNIINLIHSYGLKFYYELKTEEEMEIQTQILDEIWLIGLENYIKNKKLKKYKVQNLFELMYESGFDWYFSRTINELNIETLEDFLKQTTEELEIRFGSKAKKIIEVAHNSEYKFADEIEEIQQTKLKQLSIETLDGKMIKIDNLETPNIANPNLLPAEKFPIDDLIDELYEIFSKEKRFILQRILSQKGIQTLSDFLALSPDELYKIKYIAKKDWKAIIEKIHKLGYRFVVEEEEIINSKKDIIVEYRKRMYKLQRLQQFMELLDQAQQLLNQEQKELEERMGLNCDDNKTIK